MYLEITANRWKFEYYFLFRLFGKSIQIGNKRQHWEKKGIREFLHSKVEVKHYLKGYIQTQRAFDEKEIDWKRAE